MGARLCDAPGPALCCRSHAEYGADRGERLRLRQQPRGGQRQPGRPAIRESCPSCRPAPRFTRITPMVVAGAFVSQNAAATDRQAADAAAVAAEATEKDKGTPN